MSLFMLTFQMQSSLYYPKLNNMNQVNVHIPSKSVLYIRSVIFWLGFVLSIALIATLVIIAYPLKADVRLKIARLWATMSLWLLKVICKLEYEIEGTENITERNAIVFCKHQSTWETIALHHIIPLGRWVFKRELLKIPVFGWALGCTDPIAINRGAGRAAVNQLVNQGTEKLQQGKWINIFPEGTRAKPGAEARYKMGGAILASRSSYPILPIAHNAGEYWPRHSFIKWPGRIKVCVGPLIESEGREPDEIMADAKSWIENKMQQISNPDHFDRAG